MVARVDTALREELGVVDGLADPNVYVLDPAAGTGSYLVEVLRHIAARLRENGDDGLLGYNLKQAALRRVVGFEILPAPFVVSHLQLGLLLQNEGAPLKDDDSERAAMYLTNSLTGWQIPEKTQLRLLFPELQQERDAAERVKREAPILVVIGNPPYNGFAGVAVTEERQLSAAYRTTEQAPTPQGQGLNDLYVRFFRMAERRIVEQTGRGVICYISNYSWLDGLSFTGMRERYLKVFDQITVDCLNGDKYRTGKLTPSGAPDPSVFSTEFNPEGIQVGTAITTLVRKEQHAPATAVRFRNKWGSGKRAELAAEARDGAEFEYQDLHPPLELGLPFQPSHVQAGYLSWPPLPRLFPASFPGVKTSRDDVVVGVDREALISRMEKYFDPAVMDADVATTAPSAMRSTARFDAHSTRQYLTARGFLPGNTVRYVYRPYDLRWLYWEPETKLLDEKRSEYVSHVSPTNPWLELRQKQPMDKFDRGYTVRALADNFGNGLSSFFPLYLRTAPSGDRSLLSVSADEWAENISEAGRNYLVLIGAEAPQLFYHAVSVLRSPCYRRENSTALRQDWPRVPLPLNLDLLAGSADLGRHVAALFDPEEPVLGVDGTPIRAELRPIAVVARQGGGALDPDAGDLAVTARWGHAGQGGTVMPGSGRAVRREYTAEERHAVDVGALALGLTPELVFAQLGDVTYDIYLNDNAYWRNVPEAVWKHTIDGYQVMKKWLSYREQPLLGRPLRADEAQYVGAVARRIAAILLLEPALDANYQSVKENIFTWSAAGEPVPTA